MDSTIALSYSEKAELRQLLYVLLPRPLNKFGGYERDNDELKKNIFAALRFAKNELDQKTWIVDNITKILRQNKCVPPAQIQKISHKQGENQKNIELETGLKTLRQKLFDQEKDSQTYFTLIGLLEQLKSLNEKTFLNFKLKLFQLKENYLFRDCLTEIATRFTKPSADTEKICNLVKIIIKLGPAQVFDDLKDISNPQLKQLLERLVEFMKTDCVHITSRANPLNELLRAYLQPDKEIISILESLPDKIKLLCRPFCQQFMRLRQKNNSEGKPSLDFPRYPRYSEYLLDPSIKKASDESIEQLVKDFSYSKQKNDLLQKQLNDIKQCLANLNKIGQSQTVSSQIEKSLNKFDEETEYSLGRIYKHLTNYSEMTRQKQLDASSISTERKNFSYSFYRSPQAKQVDSSFKEDKNSSQQFEENDQDLKNRLRRTEQQLEKLQKQMQNPGQKQNSLIEQNEQLKAQVLCLKEQLNQRIEENRSLKTQIIRMNSDFKKSKNTALSRRSDDPKDQSESFVEMLKDSKVKIKDNVQIQNLRKQLKLQKDKNETLTALIVDHENKLKKYQNRQKQAPFNDKSYEDLKKENTQLVQLLLLKQNHKKTESIALSQIENIKENNAKSLQRYKQLEDQASSLINQQNSVKAQNELLKTEIMYINEELKAFKQSQLAFTEQRKKMKELNQMFDQLSRKYDDLNIQCEQLRKQNNEFKERQQSPFSFAQNALPKKQQMGIYERRNQINNKYKELLQSSAKRENDLKKEIELKQIQLGQLRELQANSELSFAPMRAKIGYLQDNIRQLNKELTFSKNETAKKQQQIFQLRSKLNRYQSAKK